MLLVSVLMTSYNREKFIGQAIESVLESSYPSFELILVDDASSDKTLAIAQKYAAADSRIKVYQNKINLGQFQNRNKAASLASGKYLVYVDSDDTIQADALDYIVAAFEKFPESEYATICRRNDIKEPTLFSSGDVIRKHFLETSILHFGPGGTVISKDLFEKIGGFPDIYGPASDMYYNIKAACHTSVLLLPYNYQNYRRHEGQAVNDRFGYLYHGYRYFRDIMQLTELPLNEQQREFLRIKAKRRFLVNNFRYLKQTRNIKKCLSAFRLADFSIKDIFQGIFN